MASQDGNGSSTQAKAKAAETRRANLQGGLEAQDSTADKWALSTSDAVDRFVEDNQLEGRDISRTEAEALQLALDDAGERNAGRLRNNDPDAYLDSPYPRVVAAASAISSGRIDKLDEQSITFMAEFAGGSLSGTPVDPLATNAAKLMLPHIARNLNASQARKILSSNRPVALSSSFNDQGGRSEINRFRRGLVSGALDTLGSAGNPRDFNTLKSFGRSLIDESPDFRQFKQVG